MLLWLEKAVALVLPVLSFSLSWVYEEKGQNTKVGVTERKPSKSRNSFACFYRVLSQQTVTTEVIIFYCPAPLKSKTYQFNGHGRIDLNEKFVLFGSEQHFGRK